MLESGFFHLLADKAESNACFSAAAQFLPNSTVGVSMAQEHEAICPRSLRQTVWLLLPATLVPRPTSQSINFLGSWEM